MSKQLNNYIIACAKLEKIKNRAFEFIKINNNKVSEYDVQKFILAEFKKEKLVNNVDKPIVAFGTNTSFVHYYPERNSKIIKKGNLILIDLWAKYGKGYYADITWTGYTGEVPKKILEIFNHVVKSRDLALKFIRRKLKDNKVSKIKKFPKGKDVDKVVRDYFEKNKLGKYYLHSTGHSLGLDHVHGKSFYLSKKGDKWIKQKIPFTIEPGLYFKNRFGIRSEINCYIDKDKLFTTGKVQRKLIKL